MLFRALIFAILLTSFNASALSIMVVNVTEPRTNLTEPAPTLISTEQKLEAWTNQIPESLKPSVTVIVNNRLKTGKNSTVGLSILSRLPKVKASHNLIATRNLAIVQATLRLPDQRRLQVLAVRFPDREKLPVAHGKALLSLNKIRNALPKEDLVLVAGDFGVSRELENKERFNELQLQTHWLLGHQLGCRTSASAACQGTFTQNNIESFRETILLDKDFYDGLKNWRVSRDQTLALRPPLPRDEEHWPLLVSIEQVR